MNIKRLKQYFLDRIETHTLKIFNNIDQGRLINKILMLLLIKKYLIDIFVKQLNCNYFYLDS